MYIPGITSVLGTTLCSVCLSMACESIVSSDKCRRLWADNELTLDPCCEVAIGNSPPGFGRCSVVGAPVGCRPGPIDAVAILSPYGLSILKSATTTCFTGEKAADLLK